MAPSYFLQRILPVRDRLAAIRTSLANERTLLAYFRTGLALLVGALTARELVTDPVLRTVAAVLAFIGAITVIFGLWRFNRVRDEVNAMQGE